MRSKTILESKNHALFGRNRLVDILIKFQVVNQNQGVKLAHFVENFLDMGNYIPQYGKKLHARGSCNVEKAGRIGIGRRKARAGNNGISGAIRFILRGF
jgi:hypothetical protein